MKTIFRQKTLFTFLSLFLIIGVLHAQPETPQKSYQKHDFDRIKTKSIPQIDPCQRLEAIEGQPFLGIYMEYNNSQEADGVLLKSIIEKTGAAEAKLETGDKITEIDGKVMNTHHDLIDYVKTKKPGDQIKIKLLRNNLTKNIEAELGSWADSPDAKRTIIHLSEKCEEKINPCGEIQKIEDRAFLGVYMSYYASPEEKGVLLTGVIKKMGAARAKLETGDRITEIDGILMNTFQDVKNYIKTKKPGNRIKIKLLRNNLTKNIKVRLDSWADSRNGKRKISYLIEKCEEKNATLRDAPNVPENKENESKSILGIEKNIEVSVYPNPTTAIVNIEYKGEKAPLQIQITSIDGKLINTQTVNDFEGEYQQTINLSEYTSGIYIITFSQGEDQISKQIIVE